MYKIILPNFEGPFDLLLYFIKRDELNIYDIPIFKITSEFLNYIRLIKFFDLELAGEFILMASTLMYVKAQMLLPRTTEDGESEIEDPRTNLIQKLLEYKQMKEASLNLVELSESQKYIYYRTLFEADRESLSADNTYKNATLFDLLRAFNKAIERNQVEVPFMHIVSLESVSVDEKKAIIKDLLIKSQRISFFELTYSLNRQHVVAVFLAILEMMKIRDIYIMQSENFDDIIITHRPELN